MQKYLGFAEALFDEWIQSDIRCVTGRQLRQSGDPGGEAFFGPCHGHIQHG